MWDFIKTSVSVLGLFVILVLVVGLYSSLVQDKPKESDDKSEVKYETLPDSSTSTESSTSSDFMDVDYDEDNLEDIPTF